MRITIDDHFLDDAMRGSGLPTKRAVVEAGLKLLIQIQRQASIRKLREKVKFSGDYDYKKMRGGRFQQ